jgi:hypothetical protein
METTRWEETAWGSLDVRDYDAHILRAEAAGLRVPKDKIEETWSTLGNKFFSLFLKKPWIQKGCGVLSKIYSQNQSTMYVF